MPLAIFTSGGDSAGMNPAIKKTVEKGWERGDEVYLVYDGLEGLIDDKIYQAKHSEISGIVHKGGTVLRSSRSPRFFEYENRKIAYENLERRGVDKLVVCGGDGTFRALEQFYKDFGMNFIGIPSTIDNDIFGTDYCLGVDTALNVIREAVDKLRDTAASFKRAFVVEVMGRDCGYLGVVSAITSGAEVCIVPELEYDLESIGKRLKAEIENGRTYVLAVVSEGTKASTEVVEWLKNDVKIDTRITILGHVQRGGSPTVFDRRMGFEFASMAVDKLYSENKCHYVVVHNGGEFGFESIDYVTSQKYQIPDDLMKLATNITK
ncbi:MAG: 6-phosphofructokinase [Campylobacterales bacterium]